jgi:MoxR-like ATPase
MASGVFRIYRGQGSPSISPPARPASLPRIQRQVLTDPSGYKADPALVDAVNVALLLGQPLLLTGEAGTGKTMLAKSLAWELGYPLEVYETRSTSTATDLFYTYNALAQFHEAQLAARQPTPPPVANPVEPLSVERPERQGLRFLRFNALGAAIVRACDRAAVADVLPPGFDHPGEPVRSVVLLDEIDKSPRDLPNDVLSALDAMAFTVAELGNARIEADPDLRPVLVLTSNSEKALPDPFLRRCIFYHIPFPGTEQLREIVLARLAWTAEPNGLLDDALDLFGRLRNSTALRKRPATAELLGWLMALRHQDGDRGNPLARATLADLLRCLPCLVKTVEDLPIAEDEVRRWAGQRKGTTS